MDISYRRQQPVSRLEHLLARLLVGQRRLRPSDPRVDLVLAVDVEFRQV